MTTSTHGEAIPAAARVRSTRFTRARGIVKPAAYGEPMLWLTGGGLAAAMLMIVGLLLLVAYQGITTFWPRPVVAIRLIDGTVATGEVTRENEYRPADAVFDRLPQDHASRAREAVEAAGGTATRRLVRTGNFELTNEHFRWVDDFAVAAEERPHWALVLERTSWGRFYGTPTGFEIDGRDTGEGPEAAWQLFREHHADVRERWSMRRELETHEIGEINRELEDARLALRAAAMRYGKDSDNHTAMAAQYVELEKRVGHRFAELRSDIDALNAENARFALVMHTAEGATAKIDLDDIVRAYPANQLSWTQKLGVYFSRWAEFLADDPREANSEGGVFPAIFGTVVMTLIMSLAVTPFGVLAALYLREYAKPGPAVSAVRIAINNLAGVPSIVFGVFGLGFFCYIIGASVDELFFSAKLPNPTYGTGGVLWASLTLALLTLPVVIVATEEALAAVPSSMREGSYACGASKWQTIQRIVMPRAMPGIMTGMILAIARGAGEVAPLMLVGAVKLAPELPLDGAFPYFHLERSFMHLGFHIYDLGFQSQNSEAAKPMVYTTTLLLIAIVASLNLSAVALRTRLARRFVASKF